MKRFSSPLSLALLAFGSLLLASCAKLPSEIPPAMVSSTLYSKMNCKELLFTRDAEILNLERLSKQQSNQRNWDIALNLLLIPGAGAVTGDSESDVAKSKGAIIAIQNEIDKRCIKDEENEEIIQEKLSYFFYNEPDPDMDISLQNEPSPPSQVP